MKHKAACHLALFAVLLSTLSGGPRVKSADSDTERLERAVFDQINTYRVRRGLEALRWDDRLAAQASAHSRAMAGGERGFGHTGFKERVETSGIEYASAAENVGQNQGFDDPAGQAVEGWLHSRGHRTNIQGDFNLTGVGIARSPNGTFFFTQIFMLTRDRK